MFACPPLTATHERQENEPTHKTRGSRIRSHLIVVTEMRKIDCTYFCIEFILRMILLTTAGHKRTQPSVRGIFFLNASHFKSS
jgi:hypothetical protein